MIADDVCEGLFVVRAGKVAELVELLGVPNVSFRTWRLGTSGRRQAQLSLKLGLSSKTDVALIQADASVSVLMQALSMFPLAQERQASPTVSTTSDGSTRE